MSTKTVTSKAAATLGKKGGEARMTTMSPEERTERARHAALSSTPEERVANARKAAAARWARVITPSPDGQAPSSRSC